MTPPTFFVDETYGLRLIRLLQAIDLPAVSYRDVPGIESGDRDLLTWRAGRVSWPADPTLLAHLGTSLTESAVIDAFRRASGTTSRGGARQPLPLMLLPLCQRAAVDRTQSYSPNVAF